MGHRVGDIIRLAKQMFGARDGNQGRHSVDVTVDDPNARPAPLPIHDGMKTEVDDDDIKRFCKKLNQDPKPFLAALRGDKKGGKK